MVHANSTGTSGGQEGAPLPWGLVFALSFGNTAHFFSICSLFSYAGVMCVDLGWVTDRTRAGFVAGFLASANTMGRVPFAPFWGRFADRHGCSLAMQLTFASTALGCLLFGFCTNWTAALLVRCLLLGAGNGWSTVFCLASIELAGPEHQTRLTGYVFASGQLVTMVAPALGGFTYGLVPRFPAIVPNLVGSGLALAALVTCRLWLPHARTGYRQCDGAQEDVKGARRGIELAVSEEVAPDASPSKTSDRLPLCRLVRTWPFPLLIAQRAVYGFNTFSMFDVFPLWCIASVAVGGLDMSQQTLGSTLSASALLALPAISQMHRVVRAWGFRASTCGAAVTKVMSLCTLPFASHTASVLPLYVLYTFASSLQGAAFIGMTNNAAPPSQRGAVNGVAVAFESMAKGLGPMAGALLFAWSVATFGSLGHPLAFFVIGLLELVIVGVAYLPGAVEASEPQRRGPSPVGDEGLDGLGGRPSGPSGPNVPAPHKLGTELEVDVVRDNIKQDDDE